MKKLFAVLVALTLVLSMGTIALAANGGSITITNAINGETYDAYRIFDLESYNVDNKTYSYKLSTKWAGFDQVAGINAYFKLNELGYVEWVASEADDSEEIKAFAEAAFAFVKSRNADEDPDNNIAIDGTAVANGNTATISNLTLGYYLVDTSLGTLCSITTTKPDASVTDKNGEPTIQKKIVENGNLVDANNVAIGDTVNYQATVTAGNGTVNYVIHDTFSAGLDFDKNSVVVKNTTDNYTLVAGTDYVLKTDDTCGCTFEIDLTPAYEENQLSVDETIVVTYSATLNDKAVIGSTGNPNEIILNYGNAQKTNKDYVITYTTELTIDKVDGVSKDPLKGAGFTLYKVEGETKTAIGNEIKGTDLTTFVWTGLAAGSYTLEETTVPAGYNEIADIEFTIGCDVPDEVATPTDKATWSSSNAKIAVEADGTLQGTVENNSGTLLPETGGIGTTIFYVVGGLLMLAAFVLLVSKKRMANFA